VHVFVVDRDAMVATARAAFTEVLAVIGEHDDDGVL
jgi:hypothetical protein